MADITKIQPMGDTEQYTLGARYLTTSHTFQITDNTGTNSGSLSAGFNGTSDIILNMPAIIKGTLNGKADTADALTTATAGSSTLPCYFSSGKPIQCSSTLGVSITGSSASCTGNSATATKLATARTISLTGSVTGSGSFDGSGNLSISTSTNHTHSQYLTSHQSLANYVTLNTQQTITGEKWFNMTTRHANAICLSGGDHTLYTIYNNTWYPLVKDYQNGNVTVNATGYDLILGYSNTPNIEFYCSGNYIAHMRSTNTRFISETAGGDCATCTGIMIRENMQKSNTGDKNWHWSPRIGFVWDKVAAGCLGVDPNGEMVFRTGSGGYAYVRAAAFYTSSKRDTKENIKKYNEIATDLIKQIKICSFNFKETTDFKVGFIAEDTNPIFSTINQDSLDTSNCIGMLLKAVQELSAEIDDLKQEIEILKGK